MEKQITIRDAMEVLCNALQEDKTEGSYYYSWQANIAMAFHDEFKRFIENGEIEVKFNNSFAFHDCCNNAAKNFLNLLCPPLTQTTPSGSNTVQNTEE